MTDYIESLQWRYATKKYDPDKKVSDQDLETLKEAVRLSVSSMGLQPYKVLIVENPEVRRLLREASNNQAAITEASHVFVFANETNVGHSHIENYLDNIIRTREVSRESLAPFSNSMHSFIESQTEDSKNFWTSKQAYLAMSSLINAAAVLHIDATPMEGFNRAAVNEVLGLDKIGLSAAVIATIGYRHKDDRFQHLKKVRKSKDELFITI
ncbi:NAD(P)H-dependent oxidoreductase [Flavobacterium album]|uniref:NAD(P)H-dependent oxidoreductase n=1 Tax=Flavobacterium album TaxID=2175091 RepID=A0A2S1QYE9_9FLAO|nr:NAD(P)H-dependent oxidoreductase [Flavobacterium album]AWH85433.1 NAD(P)H-dependent oxidoreductase [Flavobacterium album]